MWEENIEYRSMIYLIRCSLHNECPDSERLRGLDPEKLLILCKKHKLTALIDIAVSKTDNDVIDEEYKSKFRVEALKAIRVNILFQAEKENVIRLFEENQIWYMTLKGSVLKQYYPDENQRQMGDIDILIPAEKAEKIKEIMLSLGYSCRSFGITHHDVYFKSPFFSFEMHRMLSHYFTNKKLDYFQNIKEKLIQKSKYEFEFTNEDFYIYFFIHGYRHFTSGGTGLRQLVDTYLFLNSNELDSQYVKKEMNKLGLTEEEKLFRNISFALFSEKSGTNELTKDENEVIDIILSSGAYGSIESSVKIRKRNSGSQHNNFFFKLQYIFRRIFCIPKGYRYKYPRLYKAFITRPVIFLIRLFDAITKKRKNISAELIELNKPD